VASWLKAENLGGMAAMFGNTSIESRRHRRHAAKMLALCNAAAAAHRVSASKKVGGVISKKIMAKNNVCTSRYSDTAYRASYAAAALLCKCCAHAPSSRPARGIALRARDGESENG